MDIAYVNICGTFYFMASILDGYPQSNGKLERYHRTIKSECIRPQTPLSLEDARRIVERFVVRYNDERLHSALGYVTPRDKLDGRETEIYAERDRKLEEARRQRQQRRRERPHATHRVPCYTEPAWAEDRATQRCDPSADPGPEARLGDAPTGAPTGAVGPFPLASGVMR